MGIDPSDGGLLFSFARQFRVSFFVSLPHTGDACNHGLIVLGCKVQDANVYSVIQDTMFIE
jgi:hypothetical protein